MDVAAQMVDKELEKFERQLEKEYKAAQKKIEKKMKRHLAKYEKKDKMFQRKVAKGQMSEEAYKTWRKGQMTSGKRYQDLVNQIQADLSHSNQVAADMVNNITPSVYAENINYGMYEVEKGVKMKTSYALYNKTAVKKAIADGDMIIPKASVNVPKDKLWNRKKIQSTIAQAVLTGDSIPEISKSLRSVVDANKAQATRAARTCMTAVQNSARVDAYARGREYGFDVKKAWMATLDKRTRQSHRHLDGEIAELEKPFSNGCKYPADPEGRPEEIYNCRCTLIPTFGNEKMLPMSARYNNLPENMSYEEWKGEHENSLSQKIADIQSGISGKPSESDIMKAGEALKNEIEKDCDEVEKQLKGAKEERDKALQEYRDAERETTRYRQAWYDNDYASVGFDSMEELEKKLLEADNQEVALYDKYFAANAKYEDALAKGYGSIFPKRLAEIREVGVPDDLKPIIMNTHFTTKSPVRKDIVKAYEGYPSDWVRKSVAFGNLESKKVQRGYYWHLAYGRNRTCELNISGNSEESRVETAIHELGHRFEYTIPGVMDAEKEFYSRRTKGESSAWLGVGYAKSEKAKRDDFVHPYMGKDYGGDGFELVSMGFQYMYTDPRKLLKDKDMSTWICGLLSLL